MGNQQSSPFSQPPTSSDQIDAANPNTSPLCDPECQKQRALASAQQAYQTALANKDSNPELYQLARYKYYSLKEGPSWAAQEKARISQTNINPVVDKLRQMYQQVNGQFNAQRDLVDAADTIQQQQEAMRKESEEQMKYLEGDLNEKKEKINVYNRSVDLSEGSSYLGSTTLDPLIRYFSQYPASFQTILDVAIGIVIFLTFILLITRVKAIGEKVKGLQVYTATGAPLFGATTGEATEKAKEAIKATPGAVSKAFSSVKDAVSGYGLIIGLSAVLIALSLIIAYEGNKL
jgi:hypothetical protein